MKRNIKLTIGISTAVLAVAAVLLMCKKSRCTSCQCSDGKEEVTDNDIKEQEVAGGKM